MSEEILCTARTRDELAKCFAEEVAKQYKSHLEFWQATAVDDREEYAMWTADLLQEDSIIYSDTITREAVSARSQIG